MAHADEPTNPHDAFFKWAFSTPEHAEGELRHVLPPAVVERIDWPSLSLCPGSFVDDVFQDRHTDLLFSVRLSGRPAWLYVLLEHQSSTDELMPYRLLRYMVRIWERWLADRTGIRADRWHAEAERRMQTWRDRWAAADRDG